MSTRRDTKLANKKRRESMSRRVFEIKIDHSKLSSQSIKHLHAIFTEAKYLYNHILQSGDIKNAVTTMKFVPVKVKDIFEQRELGHISSQMKQGVKDRMFHNILGLSASKKKGNKVGRLKFKSRLDSVPLTQHKNTYTISDDKHYIKLQGLKQRLRVNGLEQIPEEAEIANALLIRKASGFYFHITTYSYVKKIKPPNKSIGIDFGCETQLTLSNGIKIVYQVPVSNRLKRLDRKIMKKKRPKSRNKWKDQLKRRKEYEHLTNKKKDIRDKIVSAITKNYRYVCFQDESIHAWHSGNHGKKIQNSAIGGIIADLKHKSHTPVVVDKFFPSTQLCPQCGEKHKLELHERTYKCSCGYIEDRDIKSSICIEVEGMRMLAESVPTDCREVKPKDKEASTCVFDVLHGISGVQASFFD